MLSGVLCLLILIIFRKLKKNCLLYISDTVSGNLPPGKFLSRKLPPIKLPPGESPQENSDFQPWKFSPGIFPPGFFTFFVFSLLSTYH